VDGKEAVARRTSVLLANCNKCHVALALHGTQRQVIEECVICHNPTEDDQSRRPASAGKPESVSMQRMIHRIHTGEELTQDYTVYGFYTPPNPPNPVNFNEVRYPGDRRNCLACHVNTASYGIPISTSVDSVITQRDYFSPQGPATASCLGCHDTRDAAAHAYLNTAPFGEACGACHGTGNEWGVDKVHAR
jgi:OmcA/MtrC family decaheme c-type cytochrome